MINYKNDNHKSEFEERENKKLQRLLQKVVGAEKVPDYLRKKIINMIREK